MKKSVIGAIALALVWLFGCGEAAYAQNTPNYMTGQGSDWEVGSGPGGNGLLNFGANGKIEVQGVDKTAALGAAVINPIGSPTPSLREAAGSGALSTGTLVAATGLTTITSCNANIQTSSAPGVSTSTVTYTASGGTATFYGWKPTSASNPTLIATTAADVVGWQCVGS